MDAASTNTSGQRAFLRTCSKTISPPKNLKHETEEVHDGPRKRRRHAADLDNETSTKTDNFYSPVNHAFYAEHPYRSLDASKRGIRLLKVSRNAMTGERNFTLTEEIPLAVARDTYTAISYCAGDPKDTRKLLVNGLEFNAFASLARAIDETCHYCEVEHDEAHPVLWTDQICINQSNLAERSHQVSMMYDVYENARAVAICLSTSDTGNTESPAIRWLKDIHNHIPALLEFEEDVESSAWPLKWNPDVPENKFESNLEENAPGHEIFREFTQLFRSKANDREFSRGQLGFFDLLQARWWSRAWVVQEFVACRNATFITGYEHTPWMSLATVVSALAALQFATSPKSWSLYSPSTSVDGAKREFKLLDSEVVASSTISLKMCSNPGQPKSTLGSMLHLLDPKRRAASDPRDLV
ncbi:uncharacterized protein EKO05_0000162 [Ascochyta rabiei]|nr:uncharacterized protein EKO05_0000162 [Ascochyta rabiei]UPX09473.1 hypothetical protein EKO05_0000162 [Ascochyta rabiei]